MFDVKYLASQSVS